jgi:hypothetical protein
VKAENSEESFGSPCLTSVENRDGSRIEEDRWTRRADMKVGRSGSR